MKSPFLNICIDLIMSIMTAEAVKDKGFFFISLLFSSGSNTIFISCILVNRHTVGDSDQGAFNEHCKEMF